MGGRPGTACRSLKQLFMEFELFVDRKVMVWQRERHIVEADSEREAVQTLIDASKDAPLNGTSELDSFTGDVTTLLETEEFLEPKYNSGSSTLEIVDQNDTGKVIWNNVEKVNHGT